MSADRYAAIRVLLTDVDGVLTDGGVTYTSGGDELKTFHIRDGFGIRLWQQSGGRFGIITSRKSPMVTRRAAELDISIVRQGAGEKLAIVDEIAAGLGVGREAIAYVGDDLVDLSVIRAVGLGVAVADAAEEVREAADFVTSIPGGRGAIREVVELILRSTGRWEEVIRPYTTA